MVIIFNITKNVNNAHKKAIVELENAHDKMLLISEAKLCYKIFMNLSNSCYLDYRPLLKTPTDRWFEIAVNRAIWFSNGAIKNAEKLPDDEKDKNDMIEQAKSHLAYHYASRSFLSKNKTEKDKALSEAFRLKDLSDNLLKGEDYLKGMAYLDTATWIFILLGDKEQKKEGRSMLRKLAEYDLPDEIRDNYKFIGENI
ncbi:MAG: hypothetical protein KAJ63_03900 [Methyloprofundus sp.]|nr:hypothetical protein [Methyloprofundus sp.]